MVSILLVDGEDDLMLKRNSGKSICMSMSIISVISGNTQGVKMVGLMLEERVVGVVRLVRKTDLS